MLAAGSALSKRHRIVLMPARSLGSFPGFCIPPNSGVGW
jgi:hypothetical protein